MEKNNRGNNQGSNTGIKVGTGLVAVGALALGAYFMYGKDGAKNRKAVRGWMLKARGEILEQVEKLGDLSEVNYDMIVDKVIAKYAQMKNIDKDELAKLVKELKGHWKSVKKGFLSKTQKSGGNNTRTKSRAKVMKEKKE